MSSLDISHREIVLATRSRDSLALFYFTDKIERSYTLNFEELPRAVITTIQLVPTELHEVVRRDELLPPLYIFVGFMNGYLFLLRCVRKEVKVVYRYNRLVQPESGFLSKTFSLFYTGNINEYTVWQKASVMKVVQRNQSLTYLLRNSMVVALQNVTVVGDVLQQKFELIMKSLPHLKRNSMEKVQDCTYFVCNLWRMVRNSEGTIVAFDSAVSCMTLTEDMLIIGSFEGDVYLFDRASMLCIERLSVSIAIRSISEHNRLLLLSLQDDSAQLIDLGKVTFINLTGHRSFVSQAVMVESTTALLASFDGTISLTSLPQPQEWSTISKRERTWFTLKPNAKDYPVNEKFEVGRRETGVGNMLIHRDYMLLSMLDNYVKVYRITRNRKTE